MIDLERFLYSNPAPEQRKNNEYETVFSITPFQQEAPSSVRSFHVNVNNSDYFAKIYMENPKGAEREISHYRQLEGLPFIPTLLHTAENQELQQKLFVYEYLPGENLHNLLTTSRELKAVVDPKILTDSIDQITLMSQYLQTSNAIISGEPWALRSPVRGGFIPTQEDKQFLSDYQDVLTVNKQILNVFPGFYFDRNPRNVVVTPSGVYQVDLGVIEQASPLFDLAKLLRNGSDISGISAEDIPAMRGNIEKANDISAITAEDEQFYLDYSFDRMQAMNFNFTGGRKDFRYAFEFAGLHAHLFYLTKYSKLLSETANPNISLAPRAAYHYAMIGKTLDNLSGEVNVDVLTQWTDYFANRSQNRSL